ncbi:HCLS1-binding protein 3 [Podarcis lilfordi]|uniref:HCLS1-binding protein 3 n=1 Tax=Podarcis lilfordi TaxID=74358 RepID=A0AA35K2V5_9SAUR|nr:HCLS1-binding protein 3 [Podarcis lilfordi]
MQPSSGPAVLVTTRPLQNTHTGIDLSVPEYQVIRGKMMSGHVEYNIVAVTQLPAFKSAKHKPEDIIQFMVSKKYSEIEEFYQKLATRYPQSSLPPLPRKVLFVGEFDIRERRAAFNEIMRSISKDTDLATSPELMEFLGTRSTSATDIKKQGVKERKEKEEEEEEDGDDDGDPLGVIKSKKTKKPTPPPAKDGKPKLTIFDEEAVPDEGLFGSAKGFSFSGSKRILAAEKNLKLFEDPDLGGLVTLGDSLLLPTACASTEHALSGSLEEDTEELLRVEEDFEKMWKLSSKPKLPPKPALPKKPAVTDAKPPFSSAPKTKPTEVKAQTMGEVDILQYIQENESTSSEEPSLF